MKQRQHRFNEIDGIVKYTHPSVKYKFENKIGDGSASKIYKCKNFITNEYVVIKRIHKSEEWKAELYILKLLVNTNKLLEFKDVYICDRFVYIVTKFYDGYDLFEHIDINVPLGEEYTKKLIREMVTCLKESHDLGIVHLDIKCENYMVIDMEPPNLVLIDFGHAEKMGSINEIKKGYSKYGTCFYLCPEGYDNIYSVKSDTWSLGVSIYLFLTGDYPFEGDDKDYEHNVKNNNIITDKFFKDISKDKDTILSKDASELILGCLNPDPTKRFSVQDIINSNFLKEK